MSNPSDQVVPNANAVGLFSGELAANPFPLLAQMRELGAVVPIPIPLNKDSQTWMVTRIEEAVQILKDYEHFTVDPRSAGAEDILSRRFPDAFDDAVAIRASMISVDEPDHRRLRGLVSKVFTPRYVESLRPRVQELADELLDEVQGQGQMDLVARYAFPLPINVISEMLGVPKPDRPQIRSWSVAITTRSNITGGSAEATASIRAFTEYTRQLIAQKRKQPEDDLISQLITIEEGGDKLSEIELISMANLLIFAGHETTSNLLGIGTLLLLDHPDQLAKLKADLSLVPSAVEELLRFGGPVSFPVPRFATEDMEFAGRQIKRGDVILTVLISANRDETCFTEPDDLRIARALNRHIAFGQGIHTCLGAPLASLEGEIAFTTLLRRMPNLRLGVPRESLTWRVGGNLRGLTALPVVF